jgi:hypothetical protein
MKKYTLYAKGNRKDKCEVEQLANDYEDHKACHPDYCPDKACYDLADNSAGGFFGVDKFHKPIFPLNTRWFSSNAFSFTLNSSYSLSEIVTVPSMIRSPFPSLYYSFVYKSMAIIMPSLEHGYKTSRTGHLPRRATFLHVEP